MNVMVNPTGSDREVSGRPVPYRLLAVILGAMAMSLLLALVSSTRAGAAETPSATPCGHSDFDGLVFSLDGGAPVEDLGTLGPLTSGDVVTMTWTSVDSECDDQGMTLAAHRVDSTPTSELLPGAAICDPDTCAGALSITVPSRTEVCQGELVAAAGPPQLHRGVYGDSELSSAVIDDGDCAPAAPSASTAEVCGQGGVGVFLGNSGEVDTSIVVTLDGVAFESFELGPRTADGARERYVLVPVLEDTSAVMTVVADGRMLIDRTFLRDCFDTPPAPSIETNCAAGGARVVLENPTPERIAYTVVVDGRPTEVTVEPFVIESFDALIEEGRTADISVARSGAGEVAARSVTRDCERPRATATVRCEAVEVVFELANDGPSPTVVDLHMGELVIPTVIPGEGEVVVRVELTQDLPLDIAVSSRGVTLWSGTANCVEPSPPTDPTPENPPAAPTPDVPAPEVQGEEQDTVVEGATFASGDTETGETETGETETEVLGTSFSRGVAASVAQSRASLPTTGTEATRLVWLAGLLMALGGLLVARSRGRADVRG